MLDDQIGPKIAVLALADMARLPPSIITKIYFSSKQPCFNLPCFTYKGKRPFLLGILLLVQRFLCRN
jgi:hypothetical protein